MKYTFACELPLFVEIACSSQAIQKVSLAPADKRGIELLITPSSFSQKILDWMYAFSQKKPLSLNLPFDFTAFSPFTVQIMEKIKAIPFGEVASYGEVCSNAPRAVGRICRFNPFPLFYPCHRVVRKGNVGGFAYGTPLKEKLLSFEDFRR